MTNNEPDDITPDDAVTDVDAEPSSIDFQLDVIADDAIINAISADVTVTTDDDVIRLLIAWKRENEEGLNDD